MEIYVGTSGYSYKEWKGKFYPENSPPGKCSASIRGVSPPWRSTTPFTTCRQRACFTPGRAGARRFIFGLKAPQVITHLKRLYDVSSETEYLFRTLSVLDRKLGPVLFQFPKSFRANRAALQDFFGLIHGETACAFEFRHPSWFSDEILDLLRKREFSLCISDADETPAEEILRQPHGGTCVCVAPITRMPICRNGWIISSPRNGRGPSYSSSTRKRPKGRKRQRVSLK